jgi:hypothetical protein
MGFAVFHRGDFCELNLMRYGFLCSDISTDPLSIPDLEVSEDFNDGSALVEFKAVAGNFTGDPLCKQKHSLPPIPCFKGLDQVGQELLEPLLFIFD